MGRRQARRGVDGYPPSSAGWSGLGVATSDRDLFAPARERAWAGSRARSLRSARPGDRGQADVGEPRLRGDQAASAELAVEIVTAADDVQGRRSALAADRVDELVIVDPESRTVEWLALVDGDYQPTDASQLVDCTAGALSAAIEWPERGAM